MKRIVFCMALVLIGLFAAVTAHAGDGGRLKQVKLDDWECLLYTPASQTRTLLVHLHGSGECGGEVSKVAKARNSLAYEINNGEVTPDCMVLFPHFESTETYYDNLDSLHKTIKAFVQEYGIDQVIVSGHSLGANAAAVLVAKYDTYYDGLIALSGRLHREAATIKDSGIPVVIVHGTMDDNNSAKYTLPSYDVLFAEVDLARGNVVLEKLDSPCEMGENVLIFDKWTHSQTPLVFKDDYIWEWIDKQPA